MDNIKVGDLELVVQRDYDLYKNVVQVMFSNADRKWGERAKKCYFEIPLHQDRQEAVRDFRTDPWYIQKAIEMMEELGGFAVAAVARTAGEIAANLSLEAEYHRGCRDIKSLILHALEEAVPKE